MATTLRQVRFPLKLKLLTVMIVLIASSLIVFVGIALQIFKQDKSAYIYETLMNKASSEQIILTQKLLSKIQGPGSFEIIDGKLLFGKVDLNAEIDQELNQESSYQIKILVPNQAKLYEWKDGFPAEVSPEEEKLLSPIFSQSLFEAVKEVTLKKQKWLYAYDYNPEANYIYVVSLPQEKAFEVTTYLINKSIYYGLFILGLAMVLSVLFARPLTSQLESLFGMTQEIAQGNFEKRLKLKGHDEVGALSDSVNDMADKIVSYMNEMKEKARLENEVAVAQLVQSSFFPRAQLEDKACEIYGHFEPATECGGDWWGYTDHGDWRIFFIADATGHGVPAALLTATLNCCKTSLAFILETRPELASRPEEILRYMNQAVSGAGKEIQVTCFVASFNKTNLQFIYANASHNPPLLFSSILPELTKDNFQPLMEVNGPRLGQKLDATFTSHTLSLNTYDTIFFYTDGLTEAEDKEGSRWGERRLIKSLSSHGSHSSQEIVAGVLGDLKNFTSEKPLDDDLTVVAMKVLS